MIRVTPPALLMEATPEPVCAPATNAAMLGCVLDYRAALRRANADKAAIKKAVR